MSVQYRPELGTIGLAPQRPSDREKECLLDTANSQPAPIYYTAKQPYTEKQREVQELTKLRTRAHQSPHFHHQTHLKLHLM
jgi:hypothetical protein